MASDTPSKAPGAGRLQSTLLCAGLVAAAGTALVAGGAATASAAPAPPAEPPKLATPVGKFDTSAVANPGAALLTGVHYGVVRPVARLPLNPLANTGVNPLSNSVGTQVADFKPMGTHALTGPIARGVTVGGLPIVGPTVRTIPGGR
jgi:hypothetical protein